MTKKRNLPHITPPEDFEEVMKKVLSVSKEESDRQLAKFQASNVQKREERTRKES